MSPGLVRLLHSPFGGAPLWLWLAFHVIVLALLGADFFLTRNKLAHRIVERRSYWLTAAWFLAAMLFALLVYRELSSQYALEYLAGYGIEEALSVDNLFVFLVLFRTFGLRSSEQRHLLFFGVVGAIAMRAVMIFAGVRLLDAFSWMNYIFGAILLYTAWHLLQTSRKPEEETSPKIVTWLSRRLPVSSGNDQGHRFLIRQNVDGYRRLRITPLFLALIAIETTDLIFAMDSIPAVLAVSHHPFIVYSSNIFAVLGLRSLYFSLAAALNRLHKLRYGLVVILAFVGLKMMLAHVLEVPTWISLLILASMIAATTIWSLVSKPAASKPTLTQNR